MKIRKNMKYIVTDSFHSLNGKVGTCVSLKKGKLIQNTIVLEFPSGMKYEFSKDQLAPLLKRVK